MRPRQTIIEMFSTFMQFEADCFSGWACDLKLRRSMQSCLEHSSKALASEYSQLKNQLDLWLESSSFGKVERQLRTKLVPSAEIWMIIETEDIQL